MARIVAVAVLLSVVILSRPFAAHAQRQQDETITPERVVEAIDRAANYLKRQQSAGGSWPEVLGYEGGVSALATLALLNSGVPPSDPVIQKSLTYLRKIQPQRTYVVALQTMALCNAQPNRDRVQIQRNVTWLESRQVKTGEMNGAWDYGGGQREGGDNSNSQFAVLALHEADRIGVKVRAQTWQRAYDYWTRTQNPDGSWGYKPGMPGTGSMTCAGIGGLVITSGKINAGDATVAGGSVQCCGGGGGDDRLERALAWLGRYFTVRGNPSSRGASTTWHYYYLYGVERVGRLTGRRFIGESQEADWYREGADYLVLKAKEQFQDSWTGSGPAEGRPEVATSLALLFLSKGRRPVVMAKLRHGGDWNQHRGDAANLTAYTEQAWDLDLTWQVYNAAAADVEDLLQAPVLYISGSQQPQWAGAEQKLRDYIDRGGFVFAEACCENNQAFDQGFRELIARIFPETEFRLRRLEPSHPIWRAQRPVRPESAYAGQLWGVEYGCRTCVVFSQQDLSCSWELHRLGRASDYPAAVQQQVQDALEVGLNVLTYATNREPKYKEENFQEPLLDSDAEGIGPRGVIRVAKLRHGGGCNDAPGALTNLMRTAAQGELKLRVRANPEPIPVATEALREFPFVFTHGRHSFRFTPAEKKALRTYLERGGTLMADAICASDPFVDAFRRELRDIFPEEPLVRIPADDPLLTPEFGGFDIRRVTRRDPQRSGPDQPLTARQRQVPPELEGIQIDGRWAVVFSPYDLSCALEQHNSLQCQGYTREDAARIGLNVLLYVLNR